MPLPRTSNQSTTPLGTAGKINGVTTAQVRKQADDKLNKVTNNNDGWNKVDTHSVPPVADKRNWNKPLGVKAGMVSGPIAEPETGPALPTPVTAPEPIIKEELIVEAPKAPAALPVMTGSYSAGQQSKDAIIVDLQGSKLRLEFDAVWYQRETEDLPGWLVLMHDMEADPRGPVWVPPRMRSTENGPTITPIKIYFEGITYQCVHVNVELSVPLFKRYALIALQATPIR